MFDLLASIGSAVVGDIIKRAITADGREVVGDPAGLGPRLPD